MLLNITKEEEAYPQLQVLIPPVNPNYLYRANAPMVHRTYAPGYLTQTPSAQSDGAGLNELLRQKQNLIQARILMLDSDLRHRYTLKSQNLYEIALNQCACRDLIQLIGEQVMDKRRTELERKILDLEQERRQEQVGYFRDILFLKKELRDTLIEQLEEQQKVSVFTNHEAVST